jgi:hypothetical protein
MAKKFQMNPKPVQISFCEVLKLLGSFQTDADKQMLSDLSDSIQKMHRDPLFKSVVAASPELRAKFVAMFRQVSVAAAEIDAEYRVITHQVP